jgi:hypothetical protein
MEVYSLPALADTPTPHELTFPKWNRSLAHLRHD